MESPNGWQTETLRQIAAIGLGASGALASWFNTIVARKAEFSIGDCLMLIFIGGVIGSVTANAAPFFGVNPQIAIPFGCVCAASHEYIFAALTWILAKFVK